MAGLASQPNVILIMCDQMRWDAAGFAGSPTVRTPNLDRLAAGGVCFENAYCASPVCSPARASWLTGLYPHAHRQLRNYSPSKKGVPGTRLPPDRVTIGDVLKAAGYRCGLVGPWHLGDDHRPQHGFTDFWRTYRYQGEYPDRLFEYFEREGVPNLYLKDAPGMTQYANTLEFGTLQDPRQQRTTWTVDRSREFIRESGDAPFLLWASVKDPHPRVLVPPELLARYPEEQMPLPASLRDPLDGKPAFQRRWNFRIPPTVTDEQFRRSMAHYFALITHIDTQVGRIVTALEEQDLLDDTILVFMSDHGELLGDHGFVQKCLMYEASVRVPCLISWPGHLPRGHRVAAPLAGVDLMPTLLDLAGQAPPSPIDGRSVAEALLDGREPEPRPVFAEISSQDAIFQWAEEPEQLAAHVMVRDGDWKYVRNRFDMDELYDLRTDPGEMNNLAGHPDHQERVASMGGLIAGMVGHTGPGPYEWCLE